MTFAQRHPVDHKERPILFRAPMVRAILESRKTVTRRTIKPMRGYEDCDTCRPDKAAASHSVWWHGRLEAVGVMQDCPYGKPGDRLWVREAWAADAQVDAVAPRDLSRGEPIRYPADGVVREAGCSMITPGKGRPSIHMPRWASRILLEITEVRVERLQDISEEHAIAEGVDVSICQQFLETSPTRHQCKLAALHGFSGLWESINGDGAWDSNPWVWVVEFKQVTS